MESRDTTGAWSVGVVGDFNAEHPTHPATNQALTGVGLPFEWVPTVEISPARPQERLARYGGLWLAPASPYRSMEGALAAIRLARECGTPFVGT